MGSPKDQLPIFAHSLSASHSLPRGHWGPGSWPAAASLHVSPYQGPWLSLIWARLLRWPALSPLNPPHPAPCLYVLRASVYGAAVVTGRKRQWHPTPVLSPGKSHGRRSLVGCSPWGRQESDVTQRLHFHFSLSCIGEGNGTPLQCSCLESPRDGVAQSRTRLE